MKTLQARIKDDTFIQFKALCALKGKSMTDAIHSMILLAIRKDMIPELPPKELHTEKDIK